MKIKAITKFNEITNIVKLDKLIFDQMKFIKSDFNSQKNEELLKNVLRDESRAIFFIVEENNDYIGFAFANIGSGLESGGDYLWINEVYIEPLKRGKGVGTSLFEFIEAWCLKNKVNYTCLIASKMNKDAITFYKKNKFDVNEVVFLDKNL